MKRFKTIIIDDERLAREEVKRALEKHKAFEIIGFDKEKLPKFFFFCLLKKL